jgi:hypothetical protein
VIKSIKMRQAERVACIGEERCVLVLVGKLEKRKPLGRLRRNREDEIKTNLREVEWVECTGSG